MHTGREQSNLANPSTQFNISWPHREGRPALGSLAHLRVIFWHGKPNHLPAYMVLRDPVNIPVLGVLNWSRSKDFCQGASIRKGTVVRAREPRILNLNPPPVLQESKPQENFLEFLSQLNTGTQSPGELDLEARIASLNLKSWLPACKPHKKIYGRCDGYLRRKRCH